MATIVGIGLLVSHASGAAAPAKDRIDQPLTAIAGDPERGMRIFATRGEGHCVICHSVPGQATAGNIGPTLAGVGKRLSPAQIRLRIVDITRVNPDAVMPAFHRIENMQRVAREYSQRTILSAEQVEDLVAYLATLR